MAAKCHILIISWVLVEYWSLISQVSAEYWSSFDWHINQSSVNHRSTESHNSISSASAMYRWTISWVSVCICGVYVKHCELMLKDKPCTIDQMFVQWYQWTVGKITTKYWLKSYSGRQSATHQPTVGQNIHQYLTTMWPRFNQYSTDTQPILSADTSTNTWVNSPIRHKIRADWTSPLRLSFEPQCFSM